MGKSLLEKMHLVERVSDGRDENLPPVDDYAYAADAEPLPEPSVYGDAEVSGENYKEAGGNFIASTYESKGLTDKEKAVFRIEQLRSTLPDTLPKEVQRESVKKMLDAFGISEYELIDNGRERIAVLTEGLKDYMTSRAGEVSEMESQIDEAKILIQNLERCIKETREETKAVDLAVEEEVARIDELCKFIEAPTPREEV